VGPSGTSLFCPLLQVCGKDESAGDRPVPRGLRFHVRGLEKLCPGNTTADVAAAFPKYDDDNMGLSHCSSSLTASASHFMKDVVSRAYSLKYPAEIKRICTSRLRPSPGIQFAPNRAPEENVLVSAKGPVVFTLMKHMEEAMAVNHAASSDRRFGLSLSQPEPGSRSASRVGAELLLADGPTTEAIMRVARDADAVLVNMPNNSRDDRSNDRCRIIARFRNRCRQCGYRAATDATLSSPGCPIIASTKSPITPWPCSWPWPVKFRSPIHGARRRWRCLPWLPIASLAGSVLGSLDLAEFRSQLHQSQSFWSQSYQLRPVRLRRKHEPRRVEKIDFSELVRISDHISIHTPLVLRPTACSTLTSSWNEAHAHLINTARVQSWMKRR